MRPFPEDDDVAALAEEDSVAIKEEAGVVETPEIPVAYASSIAIGQEGTANVNARRLVVLEVLPDRRKETFQARQLVLESDIREAMARGARRLFDYAQRYNVAGFVFRPEDIEYDTTRLLIGDDPATPENLQRTLVCTVVIRRG